MKLKLNSMYKTATGYVIPRSHFSETNQSNYLIADLLTGDETHYVKKPITLTRRELKKLLDLPNNERVEVI